MHELRTLLEQALAAHGSSEGGSASSASAEASSGFKRLISKLGSGTISAGDKKPKTGTAGGGPTIPRKTSGKHSIFSLDTPTALTLTQGEPSADGGVHSLDSARIASLALHHFSAEHAALIKANLHVKSLCWRINRSLLGFFSSAPLQYPRP